MLTVEHCLYHIQASDLARFVSLADTYKFSEHVATPLSLQELDNCAVVLQIWCMFYETKYNFVFNSDKIMAYACNYYCLNLLRMDKHIEIFMRDKWEDERAVYTLSYYLAYETLQWTYELMLEDEQGRRLIETNETRNYFLFSAEEELLRKEAHPFYEAQSYMTKLLASDYTQSTRYTDHIRFAINSTYQQLESVSG